MKNKNLRTTLLCLIVGSAPSLLLAESGSDHRIEQTIESSYTYRTVLQNQVKVEAKDGVATLTGTVPDRDQKNLAEDTAGAVAGVVRVDNEITVDSNEQPARSDGWIAFKIHTALLVRANVSTTDTHVAVQDGVVTLTGTADSIAEKELTEAYVKDIEGVRSVTNDIEVKEPSPEAPSANSGVDDASITAQVKYELLTNRATSAVKTKVITTDGVVEVSGTAANDAEKDLVTKLAQSIRGVKSVTNDMTVGNQ
jgi:hyperosmotically inducible protein